MSERQVYFRSTGPELEGLMDEVPGGKGVVVTHPHPLYGGDMYNPVVTAVARAYREAGYTTLRFNFRGVGRSGGAYGDGIGEQADVKTALAYLGELGKTAIDLAGYSFGAYVNARGLEGFDTAGRLVMVSPPVNFMDFSFLGHAPRIRLVIAASRDDIGTVDLIREMLPRWNPAARLEVIEGADHFYQGKAGEIRRIIREFLESAEDRTGTI
ncbi:MAG: alpha/beta hydrolase [Deltaproteobacteria bacterium]|nr:MAG: alpha/beta hydrolase [Deltaproteobacteria bacterium]